MGTTYTVKTIGDDAVSQQKIDDRLIQINQIFSTWDAKSEAIELFASACCT
jgi:thiamine biosynthesis lipoprotein ApbE